LAEDPFDVVKKAIRLQLPIFQSFLVKQTTGKLVYLSKKEIEQFLELSAHRERYIHISYHANICEPQGIYTLKKELGLAQRLGFSGAVLHAGSGKWCGDKQQGMQVLVQTLNTIIEEGFDIPLLLENTAHGNFSVGSDITDFAQVLSDVRYPKKIKFCIDTAHAYVFGYDIAHEQAQEEFIALLDKLIGIDTIALIHLNDTTQSLGSQRDQHQVIGQGNIGALPLQRFAMHPKLAHIPLILEMPPLPEEQELIYYNQLIQLTSP